MYINLCNYYHIRFNLSILFDVIVMKYFYSFYFQSILREKEKVAFYNIKLFM